MSLVYAMAATLGREVRACNNVAGEKVFTKGGGLSVYAPTMNVYRDPRWGRGQESISEDPFLNGEYATAFVRGIQGFSEEGDSLDPHLLTSSTCKHLAAYSFEGNASNAAVTRHNFDAIVDERDLVETYLPAFEAHIHIYFPPKPCY